jgi:hypothetical protein
MRTRTSFDADRMAALAAAALAAGHLRPRGPGELEEAMRETLRDDPIRALAVVVLGGGWLFWMAERGANPRVRSPLDAIVFVSTCLSVGYHNVFPVTALGKVVATLVMTYGPALAAAALEPQVERACVARASD